MSEDGASRSGRYTVVRHLADLAATQTLAQVLAPALRIGDLIALKGTLGAGKTAFARALIQTCLPDEDVPSPTFTLVQTYETPHFSIVHADFYRLESPDDVWELGWDDARGEAVLLVEWAERLGPALTPPDRLEIEFGIESGTEQGESSARVARLTGFGAWADRLARIGGLHERA